MSEIVKDQSDYTTGDRVRIVQARVNDGRGRASIGKVGTIDNILYRNGRPDTFFVEVDGENYLAAKVEPAPADTPSPSEPTLELNMKRMQSTAFARHLLGEHARPENLTALADWAFANPEEAAAKIESQRILSAAQVEKVTAPGPYTVRLQAAKDAVAVIGDGASIEEITALAEWMLNVPELAKQEPLSEETIASRLHEAGILSSEGLAETLEKTTAATVRAEETRTAEDVKPDLAVASWLTYEADAAKGGKVGTAEAAERLANEGTTVRNLEVSLDTNIYDDDVVEVNLNGSATYLADDDINELVDYLRAAQVVQAARRAEREDS